MSVKLDLSDLTPTDLRQLADSLLAAALVSWIDPPCAMALARLAHAVSEHQQACVTDGDKAEQCHTELQPTSEDHCGRQSRRVMGDGVPT